MQLKLVWKIKPCFDQIFFTPTGWFLFPLEWEGKRKGVLNIVEETKLENSNEEKKRTIKGNLDNKINVKYECFFNMSH